MTGSVKAVAAIVVLFGAAAGISYATNAVTRASTSVLQACANGTNGNLRLVTSAADCRANESAVSWNVVGPAGPPGANGVDGKDGKDGTNGVDGKDGADGVSPTVQQLAANDPACPTGGVSITDAAGHVGVVCDGAKGDTGAAGTPFSGAFTSPDGRFTLTVADSGIQLRGPLSRITLDPTSLDIRADTSLSLHAGLSLLLDGVSSSLRGSQVTIGSAACAPPLRLGDPMFVTVPATPGTFPVTATPTSAVVCIG